MPKSSVLSPHVRSQGGFLTKKRGPWQAGLFGSLGSDEPSVPITVVGPEPREQDAPLFDDLSRQYERLLAKALNKQQSLGKAGRARRRGRRRGDVKFYGGRVSHEPLHAREQQAHYVAVVAPSLSFGGVEGYWTPHDERPHRVMQDNSLPSPYSLKEREGHGPREFGLEAAERLWRQLAIDDAVSIGNFFKLSEPPSYMPPVEQIGMPYFPISTVISDLVKPELKAALDATDEVQNEARLEGNVVPAVSTITTARDALRAIYSVGTWPSAVYPLPDGEVGIELETPRGSSFVFICEADGSAHCLFGMWGKVKENRYTAEEVTYDLPDEFLRAVLGQLPQ